MKKSFYQILVLIFLSMIAGAIRQVSWNGIAWRGRWPTSSTSAEEAYKMMAKPGDPPFVGLSEVINLERGNQTVFLDARSHNEYLEGHLPGARNLPYYELNTYQETALKGLGANLPLVIYCEGIGCELSFFLGRELKAAGYTHLQIFYGGYPEWKNAGLGIEK